MRASTQCNISKWKSITTWKRKLAMKWGEEQIMKEDCRMMKEKRKEIETNEKKKQLMTIEEDKTWASTVFCNPKDEKKIKFWQVESDTPLAGIDIKILT